MTTDEKQTRPLGGMGHHDRRSLEIAGPTEIVLADRLRRAIRRLGNAEAKLARVQELISAYRAKRDNDGLNGRKWDVYAHLHAENLVEEREAAITNAEVKAQLAELEGGDENEAAVDAG